MTPAMNRRTFVATCSCAGAALMLGGCVAMVTHPVPVTPRAHEALDAFLAN